MRKLKFATGTSRSRRSFARDEEILSLNQEIGDLRRRIENVETKSYESESQPQPIPKTNQSLNPIDVVRNIGNMGISESDSTYDKEKPLEMEEEMEMEA